ncbi:MAG: hypothetical protein V1843_01055 [bacterium]
MDLIKYKDKLEPHYGNLDRIVEKIIRPKVSPGQFKYFEACRFKIKAIWYINNKIEELDNEYKEFLNICMKEKILDKIQLTKHLNYYTYFPFYEAIEFESLLTQGKSCLDCFSKAIGSMYNETPNNIDQLIKVLESKKQNEKVVRILSFISNKYKLEGVIIDPKTTKKKSIRDLISHRERADIAFYLREDDNTGTYTMSNGAMINMRHKEIPRLKNYLVYNISSHVWFTVLGIVENCFKIQFDDKTPMYIDSI